MLALTVAIAVQVQSGDSVSLAEALARARAHRPVAVAAAATVAEARGNTRVAGTIPDPVVTYSYTGSYPKQHLTVDQPLDWLFRRGADRAAGKAGERRAAADSALTMAELSRDVRVAFFDAVATRRALALGEDEAALADSLARAADLRLRSGEISELERDQVAQEAARARYAVSQAREDERVAAAALARSVGAPETTDLTPIGALEDGLDDPLPTAPAPDELPAVQGALADSAASAALAHSANLGQLPLPDLQAGAEWNDPTEPTLGTTSVIGLAIPLPIWNHGGGAAAAARARARIDAAAAAEARLEGARAVAERLVRLTGAAGRARFDRDSLYPAARTLRDRAIAAYRAGETSILPVFDAMRGERDAALTLVRDLVAYQDARAEWNALTGRTD